MGDLSDIALNLAGWLAAAAVTLFGILLTSWFREWRENRHRDLLLVYEPIYEIVSQQLGNREPLPGILALSNEWSLRHVFDEIIKSGRLLPKRLDVLRKDLNKLIELSEKAGSMSRQLETTIKRQLKIAVDQLRSDESVSKSLNAALFNSLEKDLVEPLRKSDKKELQDKVDVVVEDSAITGNKTTYSSQAKDIFERIDKEALDTRKAYGEALEEFFNYMEAFKSRLGDCIRKGGAKYVGKP